MIPVSHEFKRGDIVVCTTDRDIVTADWEYQVIDVSIGGNAVIKSDYGALVDVHTGSMDFSLKESKHTKYDLSGVRLGDSLVGKANTDDVEKNMLYFVMGSEANPYIEGKRGPIYLNSEDAVELHHFCSTPVTDQTWNSTSATAIPPDAVLWDRYANSVLNAGGSGDTAIREADLVLKAFKRRFMSDAKGEQNV